MATTLYLRTASGGNLDFISGTNYELADGGLQINSPNIKEEYISTPEGEVPENKTLSNRTVVIRFSVYGENEDDLIANLAAIDKACSQAWTYYVSHGSGEVASLAVKIGAETNTHYLWVLSGRVQLPGNAFSAAQISQFNATTGTYYLRDVVLTLTCKPFFYGVDPTNLNRISIYSLVGGGTIENQIDGSDDNGLSITTSLPKGDYLNPLYISVSPNGGATTRLIVGIGKQDGTYNSARYVKEGESASLWSGVTSESTQTNTGFSSSDQYKRFNVATTDNRSAFARWETNLPAKGIFRVFAIFRSSVPDNIKCQLRLGYTQSVSDFGPISYKPSNISELYTLDLGSFYNPNTADPYMTSISTERPTPWLYFWTTDGVSTQVEFDALYFIPQDLGYRVYEFTGDPLLYTSDMWDDAFRGSLGGSDYFDTAAMVQALHNPLWVPSNTPFIIKFLFLGGVVPTYGGLEYVSSIDAAVSVYTVPTSITYGGF
jgi:hypothetical protein